MGGRRLGDNEDRMSWSPGIFLEPEELRWRPVADVLLNAIHHMVRSFQSFWDLPDPIVADGQLGIWEDKPVHQKESL